MSLKPLLAAVVLVGVSALVGLAADETKKTALTGTIRDAKGKPVAGATVTIAGAKPVVTGADGTYRIEGVPPGEALVVAETKGRFRVKALLAAGRTGDVMWNVTLAGSPRAIRGRIVDEYGKGLANWWVMAGSLQSWTRCGVGRLTDATGAFELFDEPRVLFRLFVAPHNHDECRECHGDESCHAARIPVEPMPQVEALSPGMTDLVIRVPPERMPLARVRCRVATSDGVALAQPSLLLIRAVPAGSFSMANCFLPAADIPGTWRTLRTAPGLCTVWVWGDAGLVHEFDPFEIRGAADVDLGTLRIPALGAVRVTTPACEVSPEETRWRIERRSRNGGWFTVTFENVVDATPIVRRLSPGTYRAWRGAKDTNFVERTFVVVSEKETDVVLPWRPGARRYLGLQFPQPVAGLCHVVVLDVHGEAVAREVVNASYDAPVVLSFGSFRVEVETDDLKKFAGAMTVPEADDHRPIAVDLR